MANTELVPFEGVKTVVRDPIRFKYKLDIGEDAYRSLRLKKHLLDAFDAGNGALVGIGAAKSSLVASTFFAPSGFLGAIGVTTAATPLGWALAAGVVGAGLSLAIGKHLVRGSSSKVRAIPDCINTPMDILAIGLFDLIATLALKIAKADGNIDQTDRVRIRHYFVDEWGFDQDFVSVGLGEIESVVDNHSLQTIAEQLAQFKKHNPDCNYSTMSKEIVEFLQDLSQSDGQVDPRKLAAIEQVQLVFKEADKFTIPALVTNSLEAATQVSKRVVEDVGTVTSSAAKSASESASVAAKATKEKLESLAKQANVSVREKILRKHSSEQSDSTPKKP